jgi:multidrug efflux pump subunit AcrB
MNFLQLALRRPLSVIVVVVAVTLAAGLAIQRMSRDVFPPLGIPTIYVAQPFGGMDPAQREGYLTYRYEYHFLYLAGISHVESKSIQDVLKEGGFGALLTGLMVLLFLRDWRSAFVVVLNIPLSLLAAVFALWVKVSRST